jgi:transcription antitermination protein NusB
LNNQKHNSFSDFDPEDVIASEVVEPTRPTNDRTIARQVALQVLYEVDSANHKVGDVITAHLNHNSLTQTAVRYMRKLVLGVLDNHKRLDEIISHFAPEFPLSQVAIIDRNILRIAIYEFAILAHTPIRVAIDEAVELAKLFGAEGTSRFVNGVLGAVVDDEETLGQILGRDETNTNE